jgi:hypothetical protein
LLQYVEVESRIPAGFRTGPALSGRQKKLVPASVPYLYTFLCLLLLYSPSPTIGIRSCLGPPLSSPLLIMKSEGMGQGLALKITGPGFYWGGGEPLKFRICLQQKSSFFAQGHVLLSRVEVCLKVSCRSPSRCS